MSERARDMVAVVALTHTQKKQQLPHHSRLQSSKTDEHDDNTAKVWRFVRKLNGQPNDISKEELAACFGPQCIITAGRRGLVFEAVLPTFGSLDMGVAKSQRSTVEGGRGDCMLTWETAHSKLGVMPFAWALFVVTSGVPRFGQSGDSEEQATTAMFAFFFGFMFHVAVRCLLISRGDLCREIKYSYLF